MKNLELELKKALSRNLELVLSNINEINLRGELECQLKKSQRENAQLRKLLKTQIELAEKPITAKTVVIHGLSFKPTYS